MKQILINLLSLHLCVLSTPGFSSVVIKKGEAKITRETINGFASFRDFLTVLTGGFSMPAKKIAARWKEKIKQINAEEGASHSYLFTRSQYEEFLNFGLYKTVYGYRIESLEEDISSILLKSVEDNNRLALVNTEQGRTYPLSIQCPDGCTENEMTSAWNSFLEMENNSEIYLIFENKIHDVKQNNYDFKTAITPIGELWEESPEDTRRVEYAINSMIADHLPAKGGSTVTLQCRCTDQDLMFSDITYVIGRGENKLVAKTEAIVKCYASGQEDWFTDPDLYVSCHRIH